MRVVWLTHNFPRHPGDLAGGFLVPLARALRARGVDVRVVAPADRGEGGRAELAGIPVLRVRYAAAARETLAYTGTLAAAAAHPARWGALVGLFTALRGGASRELAAGATLVHAHWWLPGALAAPSGAPLLVTVHGTDVRLLGGVPLLRPLARRVLRRARGVAAVSAPLAEALTRHTGIAAAPGMVGPMPVDLTGWRQGPGGGGLVAVARLSAQKRLHLALEALAVLGRVRPGLVLTILGDGPERDRLARRAAELGVAERVRWLPEAPRAAVADVLATADLFLAPGRDEGFGLSAAEALVAGVPVVVCRDGGGLLDVVAGGGGAVAEPTGEGIAAAAASLLDAPDATARAAAAGTAWRQRLDADAAAERHEAWYRAALGG
ncbi:MAG: glycosyltransferase [Gemmatimonadales bacterium]|nr:glycosyltransferase [Gemmatimonadales bacterium]